MGTRWFDVKLLSIILAVVALAFTLQLATAPTAEAISDAGVRTALLTPDTDGTTTGWETMDDCTGSPFYTCVDETVSDGDRTWIYGPDRSTSTIGFRLSNTPSDFSAATSVRVTTVARVSDGGGTAGQTNDNENMTLRLTTGGEVTALTSTSSSQTVAQDTYTSYSFDLSVTGTNSKAAFDAAYLRITATYQQVGFADLATWFDLTTAYVEVTYVPSNNVPKLHQDQYIWENDDEDQSRSADNNDNNTQQAGGNAPITNVRKGERLVLRTQIRNTGNALSDRNLGLFYDRGDGYWSQVTNNAELDTAASSCTDTQAFDCISVESSGGRNTSIAIDSTGMPWVASTIGTSGGLRVAHKVGNGGNCAGGQWQCETVYSSGTSGMNPSIALDAMNRPWVSFVAATNDLYVARFVGSGGTGCTGITNSGTWTCTAVDTGATVSGKTSIALGLDNNPRVSYYDNGANDNLKVAQYNGSSWSASAVDTSVNGGDYSSIAVDPTGGMWVSYYDTGNSALKVARYTSSWSLSTVESANTVGEYSSIAIGPDGNPRISYYNNTSDDLRLATYDGSSWSTEAVSSTNEVGVDSSLAFAPDGNPWIVSYESTNSDLHLSRYNGTSWTNESIETTGAAISEPAIAFGPDGSSWISGYDSSSTGLKVMRSANSGEIVVGASLSHVHNDAIAESHTDMTSVSDTSARDSANCGPSGGPSTGTWNNGLATDSAELYGLSLPAGSGTAQCTEVAFTIDTSRAQEGQQYRFVIASKDGWRPDKGLWRGPLSIAAFPTLTVESNQTIRYSKSSEPAWSACDNSDYLCSFGLTQTGFDFSQSNSAIAMDPQGRPWVAFDHYNGNDHNLVVSRYVGTGGTGCTSTTWTCTVIDEDLSTGHQTEMRMGPDGRPWILFVTIIPEGPHLRWARYVGSGGSGCSATTEWSCGLITTQAAIDRNSFDVDNTGTPWAMYSSGTGGVYVARHVGSGGTGCTSVEWTCTLVQSNAGFYSRLAVDSNGRPWITYQNQVGNRSVWVGHYVGSGGTGCTNPEWTCTQVHGGSGVNAGSWLDIAIDSSDVPWVAYRDETNEAAALAHYVGSGGTGCNSTTAWTCEIVDDTGNYGQGLALAIGGDGRKWLAYNEDSSSSLVIAHESEGTGSGCSTGWICESVQSNGLVSHNDIAVNDAGVPYVIWKKDTWAPTVVRPKDAISRPATETADGSVGNGGRWTSGTFSLDSGYSPRSSTCAATSGNKGYCGVYEEDSDYDSMSVPANETPTFQFDTRLGDNGTVPRLTWIGKSTLAPSSQSITAHLWNESTDSWESLTPISNSCSSASANVDCEIVAEGSGDASDYTIPVGDGTYWTHFRVSQEAGGSALTLSTNAISVNKVAPSAPSSLAQLTTGDVVINTGDWHTSTSVKFSAEVSDTNNPDTLNLCVEVKEVGVAFDDAEDSCGDPVVVTGSPAAASVTLVLSDAKTYHWQARAKDASGAYSSWVSYGGNSEASADIGIDTTAPSAGDVYDGLSAGVDGNLNSGSLSELSANWSGFADLGSGIDEYEYSIGTAPGATDMLTWTATTNTSVTASGLVLRTSVAYYINVRAVNGAGTTSSVASSNGQFVAPTLTFNTDKSSVSFESLNPGNSFTDIQEVGMTTSTNAYSGYKISAFTARPLTGGAQIISDYAGTWASPTAWSGYGFGYTTDDSSVDGSNRFASGTAYAAFEHVGVGNVVADHTSSVSGTPVSSETFKLTMRASADPAQPAGIYTTTVVLSCTAQF